MKRTICALLAALVGIAAFAGTTILNGSLTSRAVDVAHAVPVAAETPAAAADTKPVPHAAHASALICAAAITALEDGETAEDAAVNNSDLKQTEEAHAEETAKAEEKTESTEKAEEAEKTAETVSASTTSVEALGIVSGTGVRLRSGAGTSSAILMTMTKNAAVAITGQDGSWYKVRYDGRDGYISADYVTRHESAGGLSYTGRVTADTLNIRSGAGSTNSTVGSVQNGAYVTVTGFEKGWYAVRYDGVDGYVSGDYVTLCAAAVTETTAAAEETAVAEEITTTTDTTETAAVTETPAVSGTVGATVVSIAQQYLGTPYVYGGSSPSGFDCSGFTMYVFSQAGISLPHGATSQLSYGTEVSRSDLQPGDLVFFQDYGAVASHAGIYIGNNEFIHASSSYYNGHCVVITSLSESYYDSHYLTARRH